MNGDISVKSNEGDGATFIINLPNVKIAELITSEEFKNSEDDINISFEPALVMIIDDIQSNIDVLRGMIDDEKIQFVETNSAIQAFKILEVEIPDIIFMDIRMSHMSGFQAAKKLKSIEKYKHIPIIAFTASLLVSDKYKLEEHFDGLLLKPVHKIQVYSCLKKHLSYKRKLHVETHNEKMPLSISNETKAKLPELINVIETKHLQKWQKIKDKLIIFEIQQFVIDLTETSKSVELENLTNYCRNLMENVMSFDIENIQNMLKDFPNLIEEIKNIYKEHCL